MIRFVHGDIFDSGTEAIINTVNLVGVMGKGIALQFKERFPENFVAYKKACHDKTIGIGNSLVTCAHNNGHEFYIVNLPTKIHWRNKSEYSYIEKGLTNLRQIIINYNIKSISVPALGAGNGGLDWDRVKKLIVDNLNDVDCEVLVYQPGYIPLSQPKDVALTPARALLVYMLWHLQQEGLDATAFSAVKSVYFLQKFGARDIFKMKFEPYHYGPYCDKVRHLLYSLDGAYIRGFADMNKRPFEPFDTINERIPDVRQFIESDILLSDTFNRTCKFLAGNYDDFRLELLSTVDFIMVNNPDAAVDEVYAKLCDWSPRKKRLFVDRRLTESAYDKLSTIDNYTKIQ